MLSKSFRNITKKTYEGDSNLSEQSQQKLNVYSKALKGEPIAYILGYKEFWDFKVKVDSRVLVPRPETEIIIESLLDMFPTESIKKVLRLELGVAYITCTYKKTFWEITAAYISAPALV